MHVPVSYDDDRHRAEEILLEVARKHTVDIASMSEGALHGNGAALLHAPGGDQAPRLPAHHRQLGGTCSRFIAPQYGVRELKDKMSRDILAEFEKANIGIASGTYQIVGMPPIKVKIEGGPGANGNG